MGRKVNNLTVAALFGCCLTLLTVPQVLSRAEAESETAAAKQTPEPGKEAIPVGQQPPNASRAAREEKALQDARRQQLSEKEAALAAKEQELKKLSGKLDAQLKSMEEGKKQLDLTLKAKKKVADEKRKKMITLFKKMRPEQAGQMIDKLEEHVAISVLDQMDTKTVIKLVPFLNQPRVLKWINENLKGA
jgi:flagellar motility protein MotE (MotC chaperone)